MASIRAYIDQFNPLAAELMALRLKRLGDSLKSSSDRGRPISLGRRQLSVVKPYVLRYIREDDIVYIVEIRHSAREPTG